MSSSVAVFFFPDFFPLNDAPNVQVLKGRPLDERSLADIQKEIKVHMYSFCGKLSKLRAEGDTSTIYEMQKWLKKLFKKESKIRKIQNKFMNEPKSS